MSTLSQSPLRVARMALATANGVLPRYAHRVSPKKFTQPQLFACLVLKTFLKTDYRGLAAHLQDNRELRTALGLPAVPHFTTVRRFLKRRRRLRRVALDSTGLECGQRSLYYIRRRNGTAKRWQTVGYSRSAKLEAAFDCASHLLVGVLVSRGPRVDVDRLVPLLDETRRRVQPSALLADAGYDSEANHRYARETCGVRSFIPAQLGRPTAQPPTGRYRRRMKRWLTKHYGQ